MAHKITSDALQLLPHKSTFFCIITHMLKN